LQDLKAVHNFLFSGIIRNRLRQLFGW